MNMKKFFKTMKETLQQKKDLVMVSVIANSGSTPRGAGARMLVSKQGLISGTIGGGAVEYQCIQRAYDMLGSHTPIQQTVSLNLNENTQLDMACGGQINVNFILISGDNKNMISLCDEAIKYQADGTPFWLVTPLFDEAVPMLWPSRYTKSVPKEITEHLVPEPCIYDADGQRWFAEQIQKSGRVYIFGGGHVAQALVPVLAPLDFYTVVLENRLEFANRELFPEACDVRVIDFNNVLDAVSITSDDYVCIITRGHQEDILIQQQVLHSPARYIGLIGSAKKTAASFGVLRKMGFSEHDLSRIVTPIGISIGGRSPAEIAISIAAQLIQYRSGMRGNRTFGEMRVPL